MMMVFSVCVMTMPALIVPRVTMVMSAVQSVVMDLTAPVPVPVIRVVIVVLVPAMRPPAIVLVAVMLVVALVHVRMSLISQIP
jgi:hypothetical protein